MPFLVLDPLGKWWVHFGSSIITDLFKFRRAMVQTCESRIPPYSNLSKVTISFDSLINTDLFLQLHAVCMYGTWSVPVLEQVCKSMQCISVMLKVSLCSLYRYYKNLSLVIPNNKIIMSA